MASEKDEGKKKKSAGKRREKNKVGG